MIINSITSFLSTNLPSLLLFIILAVFIVGILSILYHLIRFGIGAITKIVAVLLLIAAFIGVSAVLYFYSRVDFADIISLITGNFNF